MDQSQTDVMNKLNAVLDDVLNGDITFGMQKHAADLKREIGRNGLLFLPSNPPGGAYVKRVLTDPPDLRATLDKAGGYLTAALQGYPELADDDALDLLSAFEHVCAVMRRHGGQS